MNAASSAYGRVCALLLPGAFAKIASAQELYNRAGPPNTHSVPYEKQIPGLGSPLAQELAVEGIEARIDFNQGHYVTFYTSPTTIVYELLLDDPVYGLIDGDNVLG